MATQLRGKLFGYDKKQVNNLLSDKSMQYEEALAIRQERINTLRDENRALKDELTTLKAREQSVINSLVTAQQQAGRIIEDARAEAEQLSRQLVEENKLLHRRTLEMFDAIHDYYQGQLSSLEKIRIDVDRCAERVERHQQENLEARRTFLRRFCVVCDELPQQDNQWPMAASGAAKAATSAAAPDRAGAGDSSVTVPR